MVAGEFAIAREREDFFPLDRHFAAHEYPINSHAIRRNRFEAVESPETFAMALLRHIPRIRKEMIVHELMPGLVLAGGGIEIADEQYRQVRPLESLDAFPDQFCAFLPSELHF